jgi:hypothetical protein
MTVRRWVFSTVALTAAMYVAYPYVTLYRLANAVAAGDSQSLATLVSWDAVRDGVKEDICDAVTEIPAATATKEGTLPPFGYSFVRGVAANAVDANITPEAIASPTKSPFTAAAEATGMHLNWAFFDGWRQFDVAVGMPGPISPDNELRLQMNFKYGRWVVTRAWLPTNMLMGANSRT